MNEVDEVGVVSGEGVHFIALGVGAFVWRSEDKRVSQLSPTRWSLGIEPRSAGFLTGTCTC